MSFLPGAQHLQNLHPLIVHFPIAFVMGAVLLYFLAWIFKKDDLAAGGFWCLMLGIASIVAAAGSGLYAQGGVMVSASVRDKLLEPHEHLMIATALLTLAMTIWALIDRPFPKKARLVFLLLGLLTVAVMTKAADFGGRMVYDYNAGGDACGQPINFSK